MMKRDLLPLYCFTAITFNHSYYYYLLLWNYVVLRYDSLWDDWFMSLCSSCGTSDGILLQDALFLHALWGSFDRLMVLRRYFGIIGWNTSKDILKETFFRGL